MKDIILNEAAKASELLANCVGLEDLKASISLMARYDVQAVGLGEDETVAHVADYAKRAFPDVRPDYIDSVVPKYVKHATDYPLSKIDHIPITQRELDEVCALKERRLKCLAFSLLAVAKLDAARHDHADYWVHGERWTEVMRRANLSMSKMELGKLFHRLYVAGLIKSSCRIDNCSVQVAFVDPVGEPVLRLTDPDFRDLGYTLRKTMGEPYVQCAECGRWVRQAKNGRRKYCDVCAADNQKRFARESAWRRRH